MESAELLAFWYYQRNARQDRGDGHEVDIFGTRRGPGFAADHRGVKEVFLPIVL